MTQKQQAQVTLFLLLFNIVFWPLVFFPQMKRFVETFQRDVTVESQVVSRQRTSPGMMQRIDYDELRNIFEYGTEFRSSQTTPVPSFNSPRGQQKKDTLPSYVASERGMTLQLKSILTLQGKMIATLQDATAPDRMFTVVKGDMVDGYMVVEVTGEAVVLERQGQRFRLNLE